MMYNTLLYSPKHNVCDSNQLVYMCAYYTYLDVCLPLCGGLTCIPVCFFGV